MAPKLNDESIVKPEFSATAMLAITSAPRKVPLVAPLRSDSVSASVPRPPPSSSMSAPERLNCIESAWKLESRLVLSPSSATR